MTATITRFENPKPNFSLLEEMFVEKGDKSDWELLKHLHYKSHVLPVGPKFWKCTLRGETIGVIVISMPKLLLRERHKVFPMLGSGGNTNLTNRLRAKKINNLFRVVSRMVLDTKYRGVGIGYRFQNLVCRSENFKFIEIQSSMSKYNSFAEKAGFMFTKPCKGTFYDEGVKFMKRQFNSNPADYNSIIEELSKFNESELNIKKRQLRDFYLRHSSLEQTGVNRFQENRRVDDMPIENVIKNLQQLILASPLYGVYQNPDVDSVLPDKIPLIAFDLQKVNEKFKWC